MHDREHRYRFSSWNTIYRALLAELAPERYLLGHEVVALHQDGDGVEIELRCGERSRADLVVCADGIGSPTRARLLPDVTPAYAGYVAWRGTIPEERLPASTSAALSDAITYQVLPDSHILVYPIPGPSGERLVNIVWYRNVAAGTDLDALMTDRNGRLRPVSLPPGDARPEVVEAMRTDAAALRRNREIGEASQQHGTFRPGDPALIFGLRGPGR